MNFARDETLKGPTARLDRRNEEIRAIGIAFALISKGDCPGRVFARYYTFRHSRAAH